MNLIIIGNGGHRKIVTEVAGKLGYNISAIIDDKFIDIRFKDKIWYGNTSHIAEILSITKGMLFWGIGNNIIRKKILNKYNLQEERFITLISPQAIVSPSISIGYGTLVMPGAIINSDVKIGNHVIINSGSIIEHDCKVEDFAHISPNSTLTGGVTVEEGVHIGANAVVNPLVKVGKWSQIGSGAAVINNIKEYSIAVGVPAKIIKKVEE